jgi:hypothetical protein
MSRITLSGNASGTGNFTLASPNSSTDRTLTLPDNTGTVLTTASTVIQKAMPAFRAYKTSAQTISNSTFTKVSLQAESFDVTNAFDSATNYRFQPTVAGYYQANATLQFEATSSLSRTILTIRLNGVEGSGYGRNVDLSVPSGLAFSMISGSGLFYLNGSTDYLELWAWASGSGTLTVGSNDANTSVLSGFLAGVA